MNIWHQLQAVLQGKQGTLKERIFCTITIVGGFMAIAVLLESLPIANKYVTLFTIVLMLITVITCLLLVLKRHALFPASVLLGFVMCGMVLPNMFYTSGGIHGGATVWFIINIVYTFLMFEGKTRIFFIVMDILADAICYSVGYFHPEMIHKLPSEEAIVFDSFFSVVMVGIAIGIMVQVYTSVYVEQKEKIEAQNRELERTGESKSHFFASMSHEIRSPINTIIGFNEMILRENASEATNEYAQNVKNASKMLLSLVNDILDVSQIESHKMQIVEYPYDVSEVLRNCVEMIRVQIQEKHLEFEMDIDEILPSVLAGDQKRVQQILVNLLTNAVKYTSSGTITLSVRIENQEDDRIMLRLMVKDTGVGIRKENLLLLYDSFQRVDDQMNAVIQGSGLGLTITKQLVDLMGGNISVDSIYSKGSVFTVLIPQKVVDEKPVGTVEQIFTQEYTETLTYHQSFEAPEAKVLVVDDNPMNLKVITSLLSCTGVQIDTAVSGLECLEKTKEHYYHVILLDHLMPEMNGLETISLIRGQDNGLCRDSAVIALTANVSNESRNYYRGFGFDDYLEKPVEGKLLEQYILSYLPDDIIEYRDNKLRHNVNKEFEVKRAKQRKKRRIIVTTDCIAEISQDLLKKYNINVMYLYIQTEHGRFADTREINSDNLPQYLTNDTATAHADSVSVEEYEDFFAEQLDQAEQVIHISMAANAGKSYGIAKEAAKGFDHVYIVDSKQISCGQSLLVLYAARLAQAGYTVEQIITMVSAVSENIETCFLIPSAKIFCQNGYMNKFTAKVCDMLNLHPILRIRGSKVVVSGVKLGSLQSSRTRLVRKQLRFTRKISTQAVYISHVGLNVKQLQMIQSEMNRRISFEQVIIQKASFSVACNSGMGSFGFAYYIDK